jgi:DNA-binding transcriptional LysR family regulator
MNWNQRQLQAFVEVCRLQSFSRAAEQVAISQAGMSMLIRELEEQIGARLFDRTTRSVTPTDAGRTLQPVAVRVLGDLAAVHAALAGTRALRETRLTVAATPMVSANLLPSVVRGFAQTHPGVRIELADVDVDGVRRRVLGGESEVGLGFFFRPALGMRRTPLCQFRLMSIGPAAAGRAGLGAPRAWKSLAALPLIALPAHNPIQSLIERHLAAIGRAHEERPTMNLIGTLIAMVEAGLGHAVLPSFALPQCLRHRVSVAMLGAPAVHIDLMLASRTGTRPSRVAADFAAALKVAAVRMER